MKNKLNLTDLQISSFITKEINAQKGGGGSCFCPLDDHDGPMQRTIGYGGCAMTGPCMTCG